MAPKVIAFPGVTLDPCEEPPCPWCGVALGGNEWTCPGCDVTYHPECFWGRMATLEEWITYIRRVRETDDDFEPDVVCAACRQLEGLGT